MSDEGLSLLREPLGGEGPLVFRCSARHHRGDGEFDGIRDLESVCGMFRNSPSSKNRLRKVKKKKSVSRTYRNSFPPTVLLALRGGLLECADLAVTGISQWAFVPQELSRGERLYAHYSIQFLDSFKGINHFALSCR